MIAKRPVRRHGSGVIRGLDPSASAWPRYQPYRVSPFSRTSTIFSPVRYESGVERPVMKG